MPNKYKLSPFKQLTLSEVLDRHKDTLQHSDLLIGLADGNIKIKQQSDEGRTYQVLCNKYDYTVAATLHEFLEK